MNRLIVFTDLDGTLLDHASYTWTSAKPSLKALASCNYPLIFNSSKTITEMLWLAKQMKLTHSMIAENGAVVAYREPVDDMKSGISIDYKLNYFSKPYKEIIEVITQIRNQFDFKFTGFNDMSVDEIIKWTGLPEYKAIAASLRQATEPVLWTDTEERLELFRQQLAPHGLKLIRGGRFYHVLSSADKSKAMQWLLEFYRQCSPGDNWLTMGLGDGENDLKMLENVDYPVLVKNTETVQPDVSHIDNITTTTDTGSKAWNQAVLDVINKIG